MMRAGDLDGLLVLSWLESPVMASSGGAGGYRGRYCCRRGDVVLGIVHSATGAWLSKAGCSRRQAIVLAVISHVVLDFIGHEEPFNKRGPRLDVLLPDLALTAAATVWFGAQRGWLSPALLGSVASILPDAEHFLPLNRGSGNEQFPSHRFADLLHSKTRPKLSVKVQFILGGLLWLLLLRQRGGRQR
jgi:hypothetical protein